MRNVMGNVYNILVYFILYYIVYNMYKYANYNTTDIYWFADCYK